MLLSGFDTIMLKMCVGCSLPAFHFFFFFFFCGKCQVWDVKREQVAKMEVNKTNDAKNVFHPTRVKNHGWSFCKPWNIYLIYTQLI